MEEGELELEERRGWVERGGEKTVALHTAGAAWNQSQQPRVITCRSHLASVAGQAIAARAGRRRRRRRRLVGGGRHGSQRDGRPT